MEIDLDVPMESVRCGCIPVSCGTASGMQDVLRPDAMSDGMAGVGPAKRRARHLQSLNQGLQLKLQTHRSLLRGFIVRSQPSSQDKVIRSHTHPNKGYRLFRFLLFCHLRMQTIFMRSPLKTTIGFPIGGVFISSVRSRKPRKAAKASLGKENCQQARRHHILDTSGSSRAPPFRFRKQVLSASAMRSPWMNPGFNPHIAKSLSGQDRAMRGATSLPQQAAAAAGR